MRIEDVHGLVRDKHVLPLCSACKRRIHLQEPRLPRTVRPRPVVHLPGRIARRRRLLVFLLAGSGDGWEKATCLASVFNDEEQGSVQFEKCLLTGSCVGLVLSERQDVAKAVPPERSQLLAGHCVQGKHLDGRPAGRRAPDDSAVVIAPREVFRPAIAPWVEERRQPSRRWIGPFCVARLVLVAQRTRVREVWRHRPATAGARTNVLNVKGRSRERLRQMAVLASPVGAGTDQIP